MKNDTFSINLGKYRLEKSLGKGGMGEVFLAYDMLCERSVALKKIRDELQKFPTIRKRFLREARIAAQLSHPSIVPIFTISDEEEHSFYTMPYVEGSTLKEILKEARTSEEKGSIYHLARIFLAICQAVAYAHSKKILHRDLKPENVISGKFGEVMILDWGLAQVLGENDDLENDITDSALSSMNGLTRPGKVVGTLAYLAPERAEGKPASELTDLYALGVILFQILTLKMPFKRGDLETFQKQWHLEQTPNPIEIAPNRDIPHALSQMALRALKAKPEDRYTSVKHLISELESFIEGKPDWVVVQDLDIQRKKDWEFQELIMLAKHMAITQLIDMEWVNLMISKGSFPGNIRLETTVTLLAESKGVGFLIGGTEPKDRKELMEGFCLWIGSSSFPGCRLFRNNVEVLSVPSVGLEPAQLYAIRIEKNEYYLKLYINEELRLHYLSQTPLLGSQIGILRRDDNLQITPLSLSVGSQNVMVSCLFLPDALLSYKEYDKAIAEYRKIAISFPGRMEGREARYRAGTALIQAASFHPELLEEALSEFEKLHGTAGAPLEYLGKSMVYQALQEWEEEAKCLELAIRRYRNHSLFHRLVEHVIFRLHESSSRQRLAAYHLTLLALRQLPEVFTHPDHHQILQRIQKQWELTPYFLYQCQTDNGQSKQYRIAVLLAFLLAKPLLLLEMIEKDQAHEEACFALLELGAYDKVRQTRYPHQSSSIKAAMQAVDNQAAPFDLNNPGLNTFLFYLFFDRGDLQQIVLEELAMPFKLAALIAKRDFKTAHSYFTSLESIYKERSPLFVLYGCYLWAVEGEEVAKAHFSRIEDVPSPPIFLLLPYFVSGKIDSTGNWFKQALYWEKLGFYRQALLLAYAINDEKNIQQIQAQIAELKASQNLS